MSLPGLKPSIALETSPALRLVDADGGASLGLSETEVQLLRLWDGVGSATELSARVFISGLDVEPWQVEQFFTRLTRAGLLAAPTPVVPDFVPALPGVDAPEDLVPKLRSDLVITRSAQGKGTLEVKDPQSERSFTLYDFEVSIARMLDGKRSAGEVLAAANRLGIPVSLPTLRTFLQQLKAYRFIDDTVSGGDTTWPPRQQWTEEVRELYQSALRLLRQGKYDEALGYVDAMQEADHSNEEARALRLRIETEAKGSLELKVDFDALHTPAPKTELVVPPSEQPPNVVAPRGFDQPPDPFATFGFLTQPPPPEALPPLPATLDPARMAELPTPDDAEEELLLRPSRARRFVVLGALATLVVLGVLFRPVGASQSVTCELRAKELGVPRAATAGKVREVVVKSGERVEKGAVLARLEGANDPAMLDAEVAALEQRLAALPKAVAGAKVTKARAALKKAQAAVSALEKQKKKASKKGLAALDKKLRPKLKARDAAQATLEQLTHDVEREALEGELRGLTAKKVAAAVERERAVVVAPVAGIFIGVELPEQLEVDSAFGAVVAPELELVLPTGFTTKAGSGRFRSPAGELEVSPGQPVPFSAALVGAKGTLELDEGTTPWLLR